MSKEHKTEIINFYFLGHKISIRILPSVKSRLKEICERGIKIGDFLNLVIIEGLDKYSNTADKTSVNYIVGMNSKYKLMTLKKEHRDKRYCRFIIRNTHKLLYEQQRSYWFNSGKLNMEIANNTINEAIKEFKLYPKDMQKELQNEINELEKKRDYDILMGSISIQALLDNKNKKQNGVDKHGISTNRNKNGKRPGTSEKNSGIRKERGKREQRKGV